ncbi:hypothetical protein [Streptomyces sp. 184]|uniref:hypothetical protein n=1 Tax=Streptomyces sp. 184 TaxID=1827526 RepID=UPI003891E702
MLTRPWMKLLAGGLLIVGLVLVVNNAAAMTNGDVVDCGGQTMRPGQECTRIIGGDSSEALDYEEMRSRENRDRIIAYTGIGVGAVGIALFGAHLAARRRRYG